MSAEQSVSQVDLDAIAAQLGRPPRGVLEVSYRSPDGRPGVVTVSYTHLTLPTKRIV